MTVHASKGLEAPIVFLVDSGGKAFTHTHLPKLRLIETAPDAEPLPVWVPVAALGNSLTQADAVRRQSLAEEEYRRLLYVGMTRAADRLIVCGYRGVRDNPDTWHAMISTAMRGEDVRSEAATFDGADERWEGFRWRVEYVRRPLERFVKAETALERQALPEALGRPLPPQGQLPRPLSPSGAGTIVDEDAGELPVISPLFGESNPSNHALEKGRLIHRMLQTLPDFPAPEQADAAKRYVDRAARHWPEAERDELANAMISLLSHPDLKAVLGAHGEAEISIMGTLNLDGQDFAVSGRIDRLAVMEDRVVIVDYKTNRIPPATAADLPFAHQAQLAIYREILAPLYPGRPIDCVLVYTENASLHRLTESALLSALARLKTK